MIYYDDFMKKVVANYIDEENPHLRNFNTLHR